MQILRVGIEGIHCYCLSAIGENLQFLNKFKYKYFLSSAGNYVDSA